MKKYELNVGWKTNEYYDIDDVTLSLPDDKVVSIRKSQDWLKSNPSIDSIRVRIDKNCLSSMSDDSRLGYGFVIVRGGDALYFIGTDSYDSTNQVETESFTL
jgi:hypothetical protein